MLFIVLLNRILILYLSDFCIIMRSATLIASFIIRRDFIKKKFYKSVIQFVYFLKIVVPTMWIFFYRHIQAYIFLIS